MIDRIKENIAKDFNLTKDDELNKVKKVKTQKKKKTIGSIRMLYVAENTLSSFDEHGKFSAFIHFLVEDDKLIKEFYKVKRKRKIKAVLLSQKEVKRLKKYKSFNFSEFSRSYLNNEKVMEQFEAWYKKNG